MTQEELLQQLQDDQRRAARQQPAQAPSVRRFAPKMNADHWLAVVIWLIGAYFSGVGMHEFGIASAWIAFGIGTGAQIILTRLQISQSRSFFGIMALAIDVFFNVGGLYPTLRNLGNTSAWRAVSEALASTGRVANAPPSLLFILGVSTLIGLAIARGVEALWKRGR